MSDQAETLRVKMATAPIPGAHPAGARVVAVASGKGGVGKSNVCVNFGLELMREGHRPVVIDADMGFANVELLLGVRPEHTLLDVLKGQNIWDVLSISSAGLPFLSAGTGLTEIHSLSGMEMDRLLAQLQILGERFDYILIDSGAGLGRNVRRILTAADDLMLVTTPEPTAIADAYSLLKLLLSRDRVGETRIVVNRTATFVEAKQAADKLVTVARQFLDISPRTLGYILEDDNVGRAVMRQEAFLTAYPATQASRCIRQLVQNYLRSEVGLPRQGISAFLERISRKFFAPGHWDAGHPA